MDSVRRTFLKMAGAAGGLAVAMATGLVRIGEAVAAWDKAAFGQKSAKAAVDQIGAASAVESKDIHIKAPEIAENGAVVPVEVTSNIPNTESIAIVAEHNPYPLTAIFTFENGTEGYVSTRIKMGKSAPVKAYVKAGGKYYVASRDVKVTIGGCGG
ncbi:MAG TPA: thiosulfate oxidation carrier protein SoxY [Gammaproteobacteria bacterium]|nr:thiosulfate oxidation carrier protein SoxY [Gammaproteobacteria bacterium]